MYVGSRWDDTNKTLVIDVGGTLNYAIQQDFKETYIHREQPGITVRINMGMTDFVDSAGLGMLIQLRKHVESQNGKVVLVQPRDTVLKILKTAQFDRLFSIEK